MFFHALTFAVARGSCLNPRPPGLFRLKECFINAWSGAATLNIYARKQNAACNAEVRSCSNAM